MYEVSQGKDIFLSRISPIVDDLFNSNSFFQEKLDKTEIIQHLTDLFKKFSLEEFTAIDKENLTKRINFVMVVEATAGMLSDLTPEEMAIFDAAVEGR
jgi:hypothetical protein